MKILIILLATLTLCSYVGALMGATHQLLLAVPMTFIVIGMEAERRKDARR